MNVDKAIQEAISESVIKHSQAEPLTDKIVRWFDDVISANESLEDLEAVDRRLDILFKTVEVAEPAEGDE